MGNLTLEFERIIPSIRKARGKARLVHKATLGHKDDAATKFTGECPGPRKRCLEPTAQLPAPRESSQFTSKPTITTWVEVIKRGTPGAFSDGPAINLGQTRSSPCPLRKRWYCAFKGVLQNVWVFWRARRVVLRGKPGKPSRSLLGGGVGWETLDQTQTSNHTSESGPDLSGCGGVVRRP